MLSARIDPSVTTEPYKFTEWEYDSDGNIIRIARDAEGDGTFESEHTYDYSCW